VFCFSRFVYEYRASLQSESGVMARRDDQAMAALEVLATKLDS